MNHTLNIIWAALLVLLFACNSAEKKHHTDKPKNDTESQATSLNDNPAIKRLASGTEEMAMELSEIKDGILPEKNMYINNERANYYVKLASTQTGTKQIETQFKVASELLRAGRTEEAISMTKQLIQNINDQGIQLTPRLQTTLLHQLAISYIRLGEQQNCIHNHTDQSCLYPIEGKGIHKMEEGSRTAIAYYDQILEKYPEDFVALYLLNLAYMTLGEYPDRVPSQWRIDPEKLESEYPIPRFVNIADNLGLDVNDNCGGVVMEDFDRDGYLDLMVSSWALDEQVRYFKNNGDGTFTDRTEEAGIKGIVGGLNMNHTDYNNDGYPDVWIMRGAWLAEGDHPNSLLRNNGDGTFDDVTRAAGLYSKHPTQASVWADFNRDGWLDVFIGNESRKTKTIPSELYINQKDGTFRNLAEEYNLNVTTYVKGVAAGDVNNDGYPDLYVSNLGDPNLLFINNGPSKDHAVCTFKEVGKQAGVGDPVKSFPTWFFDYDNDGWEDIFVSCYDISRYGYSAEDMLREYRNVPLAGESVKLYRNRGDGTFEDVTKAAGLEKSIFTMGCNFGDLDNDGYLDFYLATGEPDFKGIVPNRMFRNNRGKNFQEVTNAGGFGHVQKGHGVAFGDIDNDGDQDVYTVLGGAFEGDNFMNALFHNPGLENDWLTLILEGKETNRMAIGSKVKIKVENASGEQTLFRTVTSGGSFGSSPFEIEAGLGKNATVQSVEVTWQKTGNTQVFQDLDKNRFYKIIEGKEKALEIRKPTLHFDMASGGHHHHNH